MALSNDLGFLILKCKASHPRLPGQTRVSLLVSLRTIQELSLELIAPQTSKWYFQNFLLKANQRVVQMLSTTYIFQSNPPLFNQEAYECYTDTVTDLGEGPGGPGPTLILGKKRRND